MAAAIGEWNNPEDEEDPPSFILNTVLATDTNNVQSDSVIGYVETRTGDFYRLGFKFDRALVLSDTLSGIISFDLPVNSPIFTEDFVGVPVVLGVLDEDPIYNPEGLFLPGPTVGEVIPEPTTAALLAIGVAGTLLAMRRRKA